MVIVFSHVAEVLTVIESGPAVLDLLKDGINDLMVRSAKVVNRTSG